ncbi:hypothetical protein [Streptomyces sp. Ag109_O5-10]|uniref:hypothetical protein n=1 Tax=Streptomyces sp. Ag109_O5-10 TaxID=1855349 RepID=UPI0008961B6F|nr:hypothetical protein [Streptomyces sp. Ag109_O5-10]SEF15997.1 hypothetical protein SAMN05216533_7615 [Streptomyces sp. Ag109_O5-10]
MVSATRAAHEIEVTAESLQEDLARLEIQKRALERELAAVAAHLDSVQRALSALTVLMAEPSGHRSAEQPEQAKADTPAVALARTTRKQSAPRQEAPPQKEKPTPSSRAEADEQRGYGALTEQILEYFAGVGDAEVRARDVAAALGRDTDSGSINAVRSTLDRLVGTSRVRRAGRGLYRAQKS